MSHPRPLPRRGVPKAVLLLAVLLALPLARPAPAATAPADPGSAGVPDRVVLQVQPDAPLVALTIRYPFGHAQDPEAREGSAHLLARIVTEEGTAQVNELAGRVEARVGTHEFEVTVLAPPGEWDRAWRRVRALLTDASLPGGALDRARAGQLDRITFEEGAPVREFERERSHLLLGDGSPGTRRPMGTRESLQAITAGDLEDWRARHLAPSGAVLAVVGPLSARQVEAGVGRVPMDVMDTPGRPERDPAAPADTTPRAPVLPSSSSPLRPATGPDASRAWESDRRRQVDRDVTSSWVAVAWPLPSGTSPVLTGFLAHLLREELNPVPADRDLYRSDVEIRQVNDRPILLVTTTVHPPATLRWEARILDAMDRIAEAPPEGSFFALTRRRYRAEVVLSEAVPETRSRLLARAMAADGQLPPDLTREIWALDREGVAALAAEAGPVRILVFGPSAMMEPLPSGSP
ncbi:MAG: insulinase family protein [Gemmatimonadales bacterium]|nr:MAG: insulinase family protein [Gemmatimonadales bacterium]